MPCRPCPTPHTIEAKDVFNSAYPSLLTMGTIAHPAQVVNGLKTLLTSNGGGSATTYLSQAQSYTTALAFVQALGRTQDSHGDTSSVRCSTHP